MSRKKPDNKPNPESLETEIVIRDMILARSFLGGLAEYFFCTAGPPRGT